MAAAISSSDPWALNLGAVAELSPCIIAERSPAPAGDMKIAFRRGLLVNFLLGDLSAAGTTTSGDALTQRLSTDSREAMTEDRRRMER